MENMTFYRRYALLACGDLLNVEGRDLYCTLLLVVSDCNS